MRREIGERMESSGGFVEREERFGVGGTEDNHGGGRH